MGSGQVMWASVESWDGALGPNQFGLLARGTPHAPPQPWGCCLHRLAAPPTLLVSSAPTTLPSLFSVSDVPEGAENFGVSGSSGVKIFMVYDPARVTEPTGRAYWPLDASVEVVISVDAASKALNDLKVRGPFPAEGQSPRQSTPHSHTALVSQPHEATTPKSTPRTHPETSHRHLSL